MANNSYFFSLLSCFLCSYTFDQIDGKSVNKGKTEKEKERKVSGLDRLTKD
jgi:hypothetical protein